MTTIKEKVQAAIGIGGLVVVLATSAAYLNNSQSSDQPHPKYVNVGIFNQHIEETRRVTVGHDDFLIVRRDQKDDGYTVTCNGRYYVVLRAGPTHNLYVELPDKQAKLVFNEAVRR